jgi:ubiquinol-cytochrome c reductase cytochrome c subunit
MRWGPLACGALAGLAALVPGVATAGQTGDDELIESGRELYLEGCSSCHGASGGGASTPEGNLRGPPLVNSGEAGAYYQLSTGRMPLASSERQPVRKRPAYNDEEIDALVAFVGSLGSGPELPVLPEGPRNLAAGNELYRANCQACHSASGAGGALSYGRAAPPLGPAEPLQIASAIRVGPGQMPVFDEEVLTDEQVADLVAYVEYLQDPSDPGGLAIGRLGPIPEGFVAWFVGMTALLGLVAWIGTHAPARQVARARDSVDEPGGAAEP